MKKHKIYNYKHRLTILDKRMKNLFALSNDLSLKRGYRFPLTWDRIIGTVCQPQSIFVVFIMVQGHFCSMYDVSRALLPFSVLELKVKFLDLIIEQLNAASLNGNCRLLLWGFSYVIDYWKLVALFFNFHLYKFSFL